MGGARKDKAELLVQLQLQFPGIPKKELHARILCGEVSVDGAVIRQPKERVSIHAELDFTSRQYVSRGGEKLATAFTAWHFPVKGKVFVDAGASTGGFTDFLLQHGAAAVHCVDVGYNQLDFRLRRDERVIVHERTNILDFSDPRPRAQAAVGDLSFRSLRGVLHHVLQLTGEHWGIFLLKPQFELQEKLAEFNGVIDDSKAVHTVLKQAVSSLVEEGIGFRGIIPSAIRGRKGNQEYLCFCYLPENPASLELHGPEAESMVDKLFS